MAQIEGKVSIGTGGLLNNVVAIASGGSIAGNSGTYWAAQPGQATPGAPTGWMGGYSGCQGLLGAGVAGISRLATGLYAIQLSDSYQRLDSCQVEPIVGANVATSLSAEVLFDTVGQGNTIATGGMTGPFGSGNDTQNRIFIQFQTLGVGCDLPLGGGFYVDIRLRDGLAGPQ